MNQLNTIQEQLKNLAGRVDGIVRDLSILQKEINEFADNNSNLLVPKTSENCSNILTTTENEDGKIFLEATFVSPQVEQVQYLSSSKLAIFYRRYLKKYKLFSNSWSWTWRRLYIPLRTNFQHVLNKSKIYELIYAREWIQLNNSNMQELLDPSFTTTPYPLTYSKTNYKYLTSPHESYEFPSVFSVLVNNAMVVGGSNLVFVGKNVICHDLYNFDLDYTSEELHGRHSIKLKSKHLSLLVRGEPVTTLPEAAVFLDACSRNYAHWISEVLPRISAFCAHDQFADIPLVIDAGLHENILSSLWYIVGSRRKIYELGLGSKINVSYLHMTSVAGYVPFERRIKDASKYSHGLFSANAINLMRQKVFSTLPFVETNHYPSKIYIKRNSGVRNVINKTEIEDFLVSEGYLVVNPETLTFSEQVRLFMNAKSIVASSGAALANIIFSRPDVSIVIMIGIDVNTSYWYWQNMACSAGCGISYVLGNSDGSGIHSDFYVPKAALRRAIYRD